MYNFDPAEEQDDLLEQELLDHGREGSLTGPNAKVRWKVFGRKCADFFFSEPFISLQQSYLDQKKPHSETASGEWLDDHKSHDNHNWYSSIFIHGD